MRAAPSQELLYARRVHSSTDRAERAESLQRNRRHLPHVTAEQGSRFQASPHGRRHQVEHGPAGHRDKGVEIHQHRHPLRYAIENACRDEAAVAEPDEHQTGWVTGEGTR